MEDEREDGWQKMNCMKEDLAETRKKSSDTMEEMRCYSHRQISEMEDKVYEIFEKSEETRRASCCQAANILAEEKEKVAEVQRLASKNMT